LRPVITAKLNRMPKTDSRIDAHIAKSADFAKPILEHIRKLVHAARPEVEETVKWNFPTFSRNGIVCHMAAFKAHCAFGFWNSGMQAKLYAAVGSKETKHFRNLTALSDLPKDKVLVALIKEAVKLNESGVKLTKIRKPAKPLKVPSDLAAAIKSDKKAQSNFKALSPNHRNEYIEWITEAKRAETRAKRVATAIDWLAKGKSRNWKYES
jgi:uncharacterized protein YdeI (YjbR/CyaY-like superfamily)